MANDVNFDYSAFTNRKFAAYKIKSDFISMKIVMDLTSRCLDTRLHKQLYYWHASTHAQIVRIKPFCIVRLCIIADQKPAY